MKKKYKVKIKPYEEIHNKTIVHFPEVLYMVMPENRIIKITETREHKEGIELFDYWEEVYGNWTISADMIEEWIDSPFRAKATMI